MIKLNQNIISTNLSSLIVKNLKYHFQGCLNQLILLQFTFYLHLFISKWKYLSEKYFLYLEFLIFNDIFQKWILNIITQSLHKSNTFFNWYYQYKFLT
jgi:hypothetical protein